MGPDELRARQILFEMQERLGRDPYEALGLGSSEPAEVRSAFLQLTKIYHPARFARMSPDIQRLANEVFLSLRAAHDTLARPQVKAPASRQSGAIPIVRPPVAGNRPPSGAIPVLRPPPAPLPARTKTGPIPVTGRTPTGPEPSTPRTATGPVPNPPQPARPTPPVTAGPPVRHTPYPNPSPLRPAPAAIARPGTTPTRPTAAGGYPITGTQPATPRPVPTSTTQQTQPMRPMSLQDPARPSRMPSSSPQPPNKPTGAGGPELAAILELLAQDRLTDARMKLETLVARQPNVPQHQALIHYAKGREAQLARRIDEARVELMDALQLDPDLQLAKTALGELFTRRK